MSRTLLKSFAVIGLALASCSMPSMSLWGDDGDDSSYLVRETTPPHKGGLADTGDGFAKYFLNHDTNTPYASRQGSIFDSLLGAFRCEGNDFSNATQRPATYVAPYAEQRSLTSDILKLGFNYDKSDPYQN
jgi:hypothetical protein